MNKKIFSVILLITLFVFAPKTKAENQYVINDKCSSTKCSIRTEANENGTFLVPGMIHYLDPGDIVSLVDETKVTSTSDKCSTEYHYVIYAGRKGYVCGDYINFNVDGKYTQELRDAGFPESYLLSLNALKEKYPNWIFTPYKTGLNWEDAISSESWVGKSYIQVSDPNGKDAIYLSLDGLSYNADTKTYNMMETGGWYAANKQTVAYYMDPRNFLNIYDVFMFENLGYNSSYQTKEVVSQIFAGTDLLQYIDHYMTAATYNGNNISPIFLGARSRQEVVIEDGKLSDSANGSLFKEQAVYNFYNIGAFSTCENPIICGLEYALSKNWKDPSSAIIGGATEIASEYINKKQDTLYFQKFNVTNNSYGNYSHQYQTNIMAPKSESRSTYDAYSKIENLLNSSIEFVIPVYENMPNEQVELPTEINKEIIDNITKEETESKEENVLDIPTIVTSSGYKYSNGYISNFSLNETVASVTSKISSIGGTVKVANGSGEKSPELPIGTGDIITITNNDVTENLKVVVYGDVSNDGNVTVVDLLKVQKNILNTLNFDDNHLKAADVNKDGNVTVVDLLLVQKAILGTATIEQ